MNRSAAPRRPLRFAARAVILVLLAQLAVIVSARSAGAVPCNPDIQTCGGGGGGGLTTWYSTVTVTPPALGTVHAYDYADAEVIACSQATPDSCSITDSLDGYARPSTGWPSYSFVYAPPAGYSGGWSGRCSGTGACTVVNDQDASSLAVSVRDSQPPTVSISAPARVSPSTTIQAIASDNVAVSSYAWWVCAADGNYCLPDNYDAGRSTIDLHDQPAGDHVVRVRVTDTSNNQSIATAHVSLINKLLVTWTALPAYVEHPSITFHSDDEAHVPFDDAHRQCRAYPTGSTPGDWGACSTGTTFAPALTDGAWTLEAREIDDVGLVGSIAPQSTIVDTAVPDLAVTDGPAEGATVATTTAGFAFTAADSTLASVTCTLDAATPAACTSPYEVAGYGNGRHAVTITATDRVGHTTSITRDFAAAVPTTVTPMTGSVTTRYGQAATLKATVSPASATGSVRFVDAAGSTLCLATVRAGAATCTTSSRLVPGTRTVTATFGGSYSASSATLRLTVQRASTALRARAAHTVRHGAHDTVTASGLPAGATGTIRVRIGRHTLCSARVVKGGARCAFLATMHPGRYRITVGYGGNAYHLASTAVIRIRVTR